MQQVLLHLEVFLTGITRITYTTHDKKIILVSFSCICCDDACFCTSVQGGPGNTSGSDIQITELPDQSFLVELLTSRGEALFKRFVKEAAPADNIQKEKYLADVPVYFNLDKLKQKLASAFDSPIWKQQSERCLGCGACAFVCPACACFDIQEDARGVRGGESVAGTPALLIVYLAYFRA